VQAQLLDADRPAGLLEMVRHLSLLQLDPIAAVAPSADLVAWSRLGSSYSPADLRRALEDRTLLELQAMIRPAEDLALYRADMADWPGRDELRGWQKELREWVTANDACRRDILKRLKASGPLPMRELPDTCAKPWGSTGWTNERNVEKLLGFMVQRGEVAVAGRQGRERLWDLASRVYPDDPVVPADDARRHRDHGRTHWRGVVDAEMGAADVEDRMEAPGGEARRDAGIELERRPEEKALQRAPLRVVVAGRRTRRLEAERLQVASGVRERRGGDAAIPDEPPVAHGFLGQELEPITRLEIVVEVDLAREDVRELDAQVRSLPRRRHRGE